MKMLRKTAITLLSACTLLAGCAGVSTRDRNTAVGAALGGVAGSVLTDRSTLGTVGGAAIGGVIGNRTAR